VSRLKKLFLLISALTVLLSGCAKAPSNAEPSPTPEHNYAEISFDFKHTKDIASNQFAVWIEDSDGNVIQTLFVTRFTGDGGWKKRDDALPVWVDKSGISEEKTDARSGATPQSGGLSYIWDCTDANGQPVPSGDYKFLVEGTIFWQDDVIYGGVITVGGEAQTIEADPGYRTEESKKSDMITNVQATYTP
jgi:hypothetical protein